MADEARAADDLTAAPPPGRSVWENIRDVVLAPSATFEDARVKAAIDGYVKVKVQAEDPDAEPAKALLARFKSVGLPTYVILRAR